MKTKSITCLLLSLLALSAGAECLQLRPARTINAGGSPIDPGDYAIPCVTDWNGDGRKDLLVGYRTTDKIALYVNTGTDASPAFYQPSNLQAGGTDIYVQGAASCGAPAPWVCDYDADGKRDLLVGSGLDGTVWYFRNTNTDAAPILAPGVQLKVGSANLTVTYRATPYVHDWDQDGLPDLFCGQGDGYVYLFKNTNSISDPKYAPGVRLEAGGTTLNMGIRSVVRVFDWDGDGLKDLVGSSSTSVYWCRNTNSNSQPILQAPVKLKAPVSGIGLSDIVASTRMRLDLVDWNNDGVMDVVLGNADGTVSVYEGYHLAFTNSIRSNDGNLVLRWNSALYLKYHLLTGTSPFSLNVLAASNILSGGNLTSFTNRPTETERYYRLQIAP